MKAETEAQRLHAFESRAQHARDCCDTNHHFVGANKKVLAGMPNTLERQAAISYKLTRLRKIIQRRCEIYCSFTKSRLYRAYIRPLEVSPLNNPECALKPWGFLRFCPSPTANDLEVAA